MASSSSWPGLCTLESRPCSSREQWAPGAFVTPSSLRFLLTPGHCLFFIAKEGFPL